MKLFLDTSVYRNYYNRNKKIHNSFKYQYLFCINLQYAIVVKKYQSFQDCIFLINRLTKASYRTKQFLSTILNCYLAVVCLLIIF